MPKIRTQRNLEGIYFDENGSMKMGRWKDAPNEEPEIRTIIDALNKAHYADEIGYYENADLREVERILLKGIQPDQKVLEVGCGAGRVSKHLYTKCPKSVFTDINSSSVEKAKQNHPEGEYLVADIRALPFDDASFDAVICPRFVINALPTQKCRQEAMSEMHRVLKPRGECIVESFNRNYLGKFGLVFFANYLEAFSRFLKRIAKEGSGLLPNFSFIYIPNKSTTAAPGYAHLPTEKSLSKELTSVVAKAKPHIAKNLERGTWKKPGISFSYSFILKFKKHYNDL